MRRVFMMVAMIAACFPSWAMADPFDQLSSRLDQYDRQSRSPGRIQNRSTVRDVPTAYHDQAEPVPVPDASEQHTYSSGEDLWEEPTGDCGGCGECSSCCGWCPRGFWGRAEYLYWSMRGSSTPALVTTSPTGVPPGQAGVLPGATILFGNDRINGGGRSGGRISIGYWADPCETLGFENNFFFLGNLGDGYSNSSSGDPVLARPFFNTQRGANEAIVLAYPDIVVGSIGVTSSSQVYGDDINLRRNLYTDCCRKLDVLAGYRYLYLGEGLHVNTNSTSLDTSAPTGTAFMVNDSFDTRNNFNGGQLGLNLQVTHGCWTLDLLGKLALGGVSQRVRINGGTQTTTPGGTTSWASGGILALGSNIGTFNQTQFGVLPEFGVNLRHQLTPLWKVNLGYTVMVLTNVVRPGDQIDTHVDPRQFPPSSGGTFPQFTFNTSDIFLQGLNVGVECNF